MTKKLQLEMHHAAISVSDLGRSMRWYESRLGFKLINRFENPKLDAKIVLMALGRYHLELVCFKEQKPLPNYRKTLASNLKTIGTKHMALGTNDIEQAYRILKGKGVKFDSKPRVGGSGHKYAFFKDPDGVLIELFELNPFSDH